MKNRILRHILTCLLLTATLVTPALASRSTEYRVDEAGMTISLPDDLIVFTRDIDPDDPNLDAYGLTEGSLLELMEERSIYLNAWNDGSSMEIIITTEEYDVDDFSLMSNTTLSLAAETYKTYYKDMGVTVIENDIYEAAQTKFIRFKCSQPSGTFKIYSLQYLTVYDGKAVSITLNSYSGNLSQSRETLLKSIVDSAVFDSSASSVHSDKTGGADRTASSGGS